MRRAIATVSAAALLLLLPAAPASGSYQLVTKWGKYGTADDRFKNPTGLAIGPQDRIYVADTRNVRVKKFDSSGAFISKWGGNGQLVYPWGVATDSVGDVYVADRLANRINKFDASGSLITQWGGFGSGNGQFNGPTGIATDSQDNVYVTEVPRCDGRDCPPPNDRIQKFDSSGSFITKWGGPGAGNGQFDYPYGVATDSQDNVYVADTGNARIQKFDSSGAFITRWGKWGWAGDGVFAEPWALATDSSDNVYVADRGCPRIQKFGPAGQFITKWGTRGQGDGQFQSPNGIATDSQANVYVADTGNHRIQKFADLNETTITAGPFDATLDNTPSFAFEADPPDCTFECRLDLDPFASCVSPFTAPLLTDGPHSFRVRARDREGGIEPTPAGRDFNVVAGIDAHATARRIQRQTAERITVKARVKAQEGLTARARGKVRAGSTYKLRRRKVVLADGQGETVKLVPKGSRSGRRITKALRGGDKVTARLKLKLTDEAGNRRTEKLRVKLKWVGGRLGK